METIWDYLKAKGYDVVPRPEKKVVHLVLEQEKLNNAQKKRMKPTGIYMEKLDGVYSLVTVFPDEVRHWGRSGKALQNVRTLDARVESEDFTGYTSEPFILISEVTSDDPLAKLSGHITPARVNDTEFLPTNLQDNFHDILTVHEFILGNSDYSKKWRIEELRTLLGHSKLNRVPYLFTTFETAKKLSEDYWAEGKEGGVFSQNSLWVAGKRDETMIKFKEKLSFDVTVVGVVSGKKGSKYENTLGKLLVAFRAFGKPEGLFVQVPVSGMSDAQRKVWWDNPDDILLATIKMDAKSFTETGNLREPRFKEVRHDKSSDFPVQLRGEGFDTYTSGQALHRVLKWEGLPKI